MSASLSAAALTRLRSLVLVTAVAVLLGAAGALATPARALQAPVAFTAASLPTWQTNGIAWTSTTGNGLVFVGGTFSAIRPPGAAPGVGALTRRGLAVLDAATGAPTSCAPTFVQSSGTLAMTIRSLALSPDGRTLYVGGLFTSVNGVSRNNVAALDVATCTLRSTFLARAAGIVRSLIATAPAVYVGGDIAALDGTSRHYAGAVTPGTGALLPWAPVLNASVRAMLLSPVGDDVVLGGDFTTSNGASSPELSVVDDSRGANVKTFAPGFFPGVHTSVRDIAGDATGFYLANDGNGPGEFDGRLAVNWSGYTKRWIDLCLGATQAVAAYQGVLYSGSHTHDCSRMGWFGRGARHHLLAETTSGAQIQAWFPNTDDGTGESVGPRHLMVSLVAGRTYLWLTGEFTAVNGRAQQGLVRFTTGPDTTAPSAPALSVTSPQTGQLHITWRTSLDLDDSRLTYSLYRDGGATPVLAGTVDSWFWRLPTVSWTDTGLSPGSRHTYRVTASDGTSTTSSPTVSATVSAVARSVRR